MIDGNSIKTYDADDNWHHKSVESFLRNQKFIYLNIVHLHNEKYKIYYILAKKEDVKILEKEKVSI